MNERRRILHDDGGADVVTLSVTTTDGSTNVGIEMVVLNNGTYYNVTTDAQGKAELAGLSGGCTITCETYELDVTQFTATGTMTVSISAYLNTFPIGTVRNYNYTGAVSEVQLIPGLYKLQVWGAQGGTYSSYTGGNGGYSEGILTLLQALKVYVFVGGQGSRSGNGGWNGGGGGSGSASYTSGGTSGSSYMACGGGGTDIALVTSSMAYSSYRTNRSSESLLSRIIVAGGGSGGAYTTRSETTSSTTWETVASGTMTKMFKTADGTWEMQYRGVTIENGATYKITGTSTGTKCGIAWFNGNTWVAGKYGISKGASFSYNDIPSGYTYGVSLYNLNESDPVPTFTLQKKVTTSSTSNTSDYAYGYVGGGTSGGGYQSSYAGSQSSAGSGGAFGLGANQQTTGYRHCAACGGGGWYGGGGGLYSDSTKTYVKYSGGGSGFVNIAANASYRPSGYTGIQLDSGATYRGDTYFPNTANTGTEYGHSGNGYAKITRLDPSTLVPLTFDILESGTIGWKNTGGSYTRTIEYSKNGGAWTSITSTTSGVTIQVEEGDVVQFRGSNSYYSYSTSYYNSFTATCRFNVRGNIMSLISLGSTMLSDSYALGYLFYGNTKLVDASGLQMPATTLSQYCYHRMFYGCTAMTKAPEILPAKTLQSYCYNYMFYGCTSLEKAPELPATTLTSYCYNYMFQNCSSLNYVNAAFTTTPSTSYTSSWLSGVAATGTFVKNGAATWTTTGVSAIPTGWTVEYHNDEKGYFTIESLEDNNTIYWWKSLSGATSKTIYWAKGNTAFTSVSSTTSGATLTTLNRGEKLYIWGNNSCYASSTSYYCYFRASANYKVYGNIMSLINGNTFSTLTSLSNYNVFVYLFYNDTHLVDASGLLLPATSLTYSYVYYGMFYGCTGLTAGPEKLPATSLTEYCYAYMFYNCTSLTTAPVLPATSLNSYCYNYMFYGCSSLNYIKAMFTTTPSSSYTSNWVNGVAATGTFVKNSSATWSVTGVSGVPSGWTVETAST